MMDPELMELAHRIAAFLRVINSRYSGVSMDEPLRGLYTDMVRSMAEFADYAYGEMEETGDD